MRLRGNDGRERLLSALEQPRWSRYRSLPDKAAALHFFLNKGHPFVDGNKRFAVAATDTFLYINSADFFGTDTDVVDLALAVADGTLLLGMLTARFRERVFRISWSDEQTVRRLEGLQEALGFDADSIVDALTGALARRLAIQVGVRRTLDQLKERREALSRLSAPRGDA